ncbi:S26 family signal peptidase [Pinisolibacter aquiterrae]|uniref:S26 family signal peptidase n=1 Tax=Pinisolibacter aquiterrae TaxID=2815579 RepID=UPI001C3CA185|nr:S26 family signal peptidase [Pinisolibacter aquiterrae]MCC8235753.1 S26 family signal peptidase [Pinisolibacter aquiterrae]
MTRFGFVMVTHAVVLGIGASIASPPAPRLLWNATASTPIGLYALRSADRLRVGDLVAVTPPDRVARFLAESGRLPLGVPLLKHVQALAPQTVCRDGADLTVDGVSVGVARSHDDDGRDLPVWSGCRVLAEDEIFVMNVGVADSLDGRYFGPVPTSAILGRADPLWIAEHGDGRDR